MNGYKYIITLLTILISPLVFAQNQIYVDSLKNIFSKAQDNKIKEEVSLKIARHLRYTERKDEALKYTEIALTFGEKHKNKSSILLGTKTLADIYEHHGEISKSIAYHEICLKQAELYKDTSFLSFVHGDMAYTYTTQKLFHKAIDHTLASLALAKAVNDSSSIFHSYSFLCDYSLETGDTIEAINYAQKALEIALETKTDRLIFYGRRYLGRLLRLTEKNKLSISELSKSLNIGARLNDEIALADTYHQMSLTYWELMEPDSALLYNKRSIDIWDKYGQDVSVVDGLILRADFYNNVFQYEKAIELIKKVENLMDYEFSNAQRAKYYETFAITYSGLKKHKKAYSFLSEYKIYNQKDRNEKMSQYLTDAQVNYKTKEKALLLEKQELEIKQQKLLLWVVSSATVIFIVLGIVALMAYAAKRRANKLLAFQKMEIEKSNKEKEILLKEIHHRVKNNLQVISSLLNLQSNNIQDSKALEVIKEGRNRVKSIALIHQKLYQHEDISEINFQDYAVQLTSFLNATFKLKGKNISIKVTAEDIYLDIDTAVPLGLIINELVSNSIKYAFTNSEDNCINISIDRYDEGKLCLRVQDNGIGLPDTFEFDNIESLGLKLVKMLSMQLGGDVIFKNNKGAIFEINFIETYLRKESLNEED